ncbi:hypothetical protein BDW74DRAFT_177343 [Aspergillus multicolor]|uniref:uncharacterized protein n=1 Tax=Aspergillus multicolor TaxID=41759 RepID=UPI003CCD2195
MPLRKSIRRFLGREDRKASAPAPAHGRHSPSQLPAGPPAASPSPLRNSSQGTPRESLKPEPQPVADASKSLWDEAYEQLVDEAPDLVTALENDLLQSQSHDSAVKPESSTQRRLQSLVQQRLADIEGSRMGFTVGGKRVLVREQAANIIHAIISVKDFISAAVSAEPHASLAWAGVLVFLNPLTNTITQDEEAIKGLESISTLLIRYRLTEETHPDAYTLGTLAKPVQSRAELGASLRAQTVKLYAEVLRYQIRLAKQYSRSTFFRFVNDLAVSNDWKGIFLTITGLDETITKHLSTLEGHTLNQVNRKMEELQERMNKSLRLAAETRDQYRIEKQKKLLDALPYTHGAVFGSKEDQDKARCLEGTQTKTLTQVQEWSEEPGKPVFWLQGMAGTGKSTISRTFAAALQDRKRLVSGTPLPDSMRLGASFFFDKTKAEGNNANGLFTTIVRSIASVVPSLHDYLCAALESNENIQNQSLENQWKKLILEPLRQLQYDLPSELTLVVIIDALDECEPQSDCKKLLSLLCGIKGLQAIDLQFFITS